MDIIEHIEQKGVGTLLKALEINVLRKYASPYCYQGPDKVHIEVTNRCNLWCDFCYRTNPEHGRPIMGDMSMDMFHRVIDELKDLHYLWLHQGGESLLHPNIIEMVMYAKQKNVSKYIGITSNGMFLKNDLAESLIVAGLNRLEISLDGADAETHQSIRKNADFEKIIGNIINFCKFLKGEDILQIRCVICSKNYDKLNIMPRRMSLCGVKKISFQKVIHRNEFCDEEIPDLGKILKELKRECEKHNVNFEYIKEPKRVRCYEPFRGFGVTWDGNIVPCCRIENVDVGEGKYEVEESWNGKKMIEFRKAILERKYPECCKRSCIIA